MPDSGTIAFINVPLHGHINPTLPIVAELVRRGRPVTYHTTAAFADEIEATGATVVRYPGVAAPPDPLTPLTGMEWVARATLELVPTVVAQLRRAGAGLVVHDAGCLWGAVAARELDVPAAAFFTTFALNRHVLTPATAASLLLPAAIRRPGTVLDFVRARRKVARRYNTSGLPLVDLANIREPLNLVFTSRRFQIAADEFDAGYKFVGPSIGSRPAKPDFPLDRLHGTVVYLSFGTVFDGDAALLSALAVALAPLADTLVVATGRTDPADLGPLPGNVLACRSVPQPEVLQRTSLFVTHGGMNSVNEALHAGVPMLVRPIEADQPVVAARVAELGAGLVVPRTATPDAVGRLARYVLREQGFRASARTLRADQRAAGGFRRAADELELALTGAGRLAATDAGPE